MENFVGRYDLIASFRSDYQSFKISNLDIQILHYHGVEGIGKTALLEKFMEVMDKSNSDLSNRYVCCDLRGCYDVPSVISTLIISFLNKFDITFDEFNVARDAYFLKRGWQLHELEASDSSLLTKTGKAIKKFGDYFGDEKRVIYEVGKEFWEKRQLEQRIEKAAPLLNGNDEISLYNKMLEAFSEKLNEKAGEKADDTDFAEPFVIFLDSFEDPMSSSADTWFSSVISKTRGIIWVIAGRSRLDWSDFEDEELKACQLEKLQERDIRYFFEKYSISETLLQGLMPKIDGNPGNLTHYAECCRHLHDDHKELTIENIIKFEKEQFEEELSHMEYHERDILDMLACLSVWDNDELRSIAWKVFPSFSPRLYESVLKSSSQFISSDTRGISSVDKEIRRHLFDTCPPITRIAARDELSTYYENKLKLPITQDFAALFSRYADHMLDSGCSDEEIGAFCSKILHRSVDLFKKVPTSMVNLLSRLEASDSFADSGVKAALQLGYADYITAEHIEDKAEEAENRANSACVYFTKVNRNDLSVFARIAEARSQMLAGKNDDAINTLGPGEWLDSWLKSCVECGRADIAVHFTHALSDCYYSLGEFKNAIELIEYASNLSREKFGEKGALTLKVDESLMKLAPYKKMIEEKEERDREKEQIPTTAAEREEAVQIQTAARYLLDAGTHENMFAVANQLSASNPDDAVSIFEEALDIAKKQYRDRPQIIINVMEILGERYRAAEDSESDIGMRLELIAFDKVFDSDSVAMFDAVSLLADAYGKYGMNEEELATRRKLLQSCVSTYNLSDDRKFSARINLGDLLMDLDKPKDALKIYKPLLDETNENSIERFKAYNALAECYDRIGRYKQERDMFEKAANICELLYGSESEEALDAQVNIAVACSKINMKRKAPEEWAKALEKSEKILGAYHPKTLKISLAFGKFCASLGKESSDVKAIELCRRAFETSKNDPNLNEIALAAAETLKTLYENSKKLLETAEMEKFLESAAK